MQGAVAKSSPVPSPPGPRVDIASLVVFRVAFGAIMLWEVIRYFQHDWIRRYWIEPDFHFQYFGFGWVEPWPGSGMYWHFAVLGLAAIGVLCGAFYRASAVVLALGFTYMFLLEQARYLNHFYLIALLAAVMVVVPVHTAGSVDAARRPTLRSETAPRWALWLLRFQIGVAYAGGGLAKLNADWLAGEPMRMWLADRADDPIAGFFAHKEWAVWLFAYGGLLFDLAIVPALLWRRTRVIAFVAVIAFNLTNAWLFQIGIFPWFMIAASTLFLEPDWPRRLARRPAVTTEPTGPPLAGVLRAAVVLWVVLQIVVPFRHHLYPGDPNWTEEGHRFAWHMKLRDKHSHAHFAVHHPESGRSWIEDPADFLEPWQVRKMSTRPDMILQFAAHLAALWASEGYADLEVRANVSATLNGRPRQRLIDPKVDLAREHRSLAPAPWIEPLTTPLVSPRPSSRR